MIALLIAFTLMSISYCQTILTVNNNFDFDAAINNAKYTATIVDMGLTNCGWTKFMKRPFEINSARYKNFLFVEVFLDKFQPNSGQFASSSFGTPVFYVYKKGVRIDGNTIRDEKSLVNLITKNGGLNGSSTTVKSSSPALTSNLITTKRSSFK